MVDVIKDLGKPSSLHNPTETQKQTNKFLLKHWKALLLLVILFFASISLYEWITTDYNDLVIKDQEIKEAWANIEVFYQQRYDLTATLIDVVKGTKDFEAGLLTDITDARSAWTSAQNADEKVSAANSMDGAIGKLLLTVENYPDLKSNESFLTMQNQLTIIENTIAEMRIEFNYKVATYNITIKYFPSSLIASLFGFKEKKYFTSVKGSETAPKVNV